MKTLSTLLERIGGLLGRDTAIKEAVIASIQEILGFKLDANDIFISGTTLEVTTSPVKKSAIKLEETRIITAINTRAATNVARIFYK